MTTSRDNSPSDSHGAVASRRELIVIAKPDAQLRASGPSIASNVGADTTGLNALLASEGAALTPLFGMDEEQLEQDAVAMASAANESIPNPSVYYAVQAEEEKLDGLAARLLEQDLVEAAYVKPAAELAVMTIGTAPDQQSGETSDGINDMTPLADAAPATTPSFVDRQGYLNAAPEGVDARYAWTFRGGTGSNINIIDLEWGWNFNHEDLRQRQGGVVGGTNSSNTDHGTAVIGEIGGDRNSFGVTGICPDATVSAVAFSMPTATAIRLAADRLRRGDIMLLEIHRAGPRFNFQRRSDQQGYIAVEWWPDDFAAIRYAIAKGIIVVEAAGNGGQDFDDNLYDQRPSGFPSSWRNPLNPRNPSSGAVIVGAGAPPPGTHGRDHGPDRSRLGFSNYGARVDAQGWGREVTTTGYGDLQGGGDVNKQYTDRFSGTSSASPIVTAALGCVQGILKSANLPLLTPTQAIQLLRSTGSAQQDAPGRPRTQRIGNRPNLRQLISRALALTPGNYSGVWRPGSGSYYLWANASWSNFFNKWQELAQRGLRLVDLDITRTGNSTRYSGTWLPGTGGYYLWVNASWSNFTDKWRELARQGLRLVDIDVQRYGDDTRYSGVWLPGSGGYYLWANASWSSFRAKWQELNSQGLRLVDLSVHRVGNSNRYSGVWLPGTGGHYLWVNASWSSFVAKWRELAQQGLRLVDLEVHRSGSNTRYSGVWLPGSDGYYLWANANWHSFRAKWQELAQKGLRLVDIELKDSGSAPSMPSMLSAPGMPMESSDEFGGGEVLSDIAAVAHLNGMGSLEFSSLAPFNEMSDSANGFGGGEFSTDMAPELGGADGLGGGELPTAVSPNSSTELASAELATAGDGLGGGELPSKNGSMAMGSNGLGTMLAESTAAAGMEDADGAGGGEMPSDTVAIATNGTDGAGGGELPSDALSLN